MGYGWDNERRKSEGTAKAEWRMEDGWEAHGRQEGGGSMGESFERCKLLLINGLLGF